MPDQEPSSGPSRRAVSVELAANRDTLSRRVSQTVTFLIIGAQKAGTTWICDVLRRHPDVFIPDLKELHFFEQEPNYSRGYEWYLDFFRGSEGALARGEGTPNYFYNVCTEKEQKDWLSRDVPARVRKCLPDARLILSLRDPVERAISSYNHFVLRGNISPKVPIRDCWDERGIRSAGRYDLQLAKWLEYYDLSQFEIVIYEEDIKPDHRKLETVNRLLRAIGAAPIAEIPDLFKPSNARLDAAFAYLNQVPFLRDHPTGNKIRNRINSIIPDGVQKRLEIRIDPRDIDALREEFAPHNRALEAMIGRPLPW